MALSRILILLSFFYCSFAAKNTYIFCKDTNGTIVVELDAVIVVKQENVLSRLSNIKQNSTSDKCDTENKRTFHIDFEDDASLKVIIEEKNGTVFLESLTTSVDSNIATVDPPSNELSKSDQYYQCDSPQTYKLESTLPNLEISVTFLEIKLQGFGVVNSSFSHDFTACDSSTNTSTTIASTTITTTTISTSIAPNTTVTTTKTTPMTTKNVSTTTIPRTTTTRPPVTTPSSKGKVAQLDLGYNKTTCLLVEFRGNLSFQYETNKGKKIYNHEIDESDVIFVNGSCDGDTPHVKGFLSMGCAVEFRFSKVSKLQGAARRLLATSFEYALSSVIVTYDTSKPKDAIKGGVITESAKVSNVKASSGKIYRCNAPQVLLQNGSTSFRVENLKAGAYSPDTTKEDKCSKDNAPGNNVVPIVVGVILACLVVIIIVAYLIGRRRNREGYQSV